MSDGIEEVKELVAATLESQGVLAKLRAELRARVFQAIDDPTSREGAPVDVYEDGVHGEFFLGGTMTVCVVQGA